MSSLFYAASKGPCKIEITTADGEKFSYNAIIMQHEIQMAPSNRYVMGRNSIVEDCVSIPNKEVTLKFVEVAPTKSKPKPKPTSVKMLEAIEQEEML